MFGFFIFEQYCPVTQITSQGVLSQLARANRQSKCSAYEVRFSHNYDHNKRNEEVPPTTEPQLTEQCHYRAETDDNYQNNHSLRRLSAIAVSSRRAATTNGSPGPTVSSPIS